MRIKMKFIWGLLFSNSFEIIGEAFESPSYLFDIVIELIRNQSLTLLFYDHVRAYSCVINV